MGDRTRGAADGVGAGGFQPPGSLLLGSAVFGPGAIRVSDVLGGPAAGPVLAATSDRHVVTIPLSTAQESEVAVGDAVTVRVCISAEDTNWFRR